MGSGTDSAGTDSAGMGSAAIDQAMARFGNWGRWGDDDRLGTLNHVTDERRRRSALAVRSGVAVSCSRVVSPVRGREHRAAMQHHMLSTGTEAPAAGRHAAFDWFGMDIHGLAFTHLDAPSHIFWNGRMYNGVSAASVGVSRGDESGGVDLAHHGIVTRGVLLDVPRAAGRDRLDPGERIRIADLEACERAEGVRVEPGDALVLRVGRDVPAGAGGTAGGTADDPPRATALPGLDPECLEFLHRREVSLVCCDGVTDPTGVADPASQVSVHTVGIVGMGLWLVDNAHLEDLAERCAESGRWACQFVVAPLRLKNSTGSPVNPIAVL